MKYSKGICWLDDTRIPTNWEEERPPSWFNSGKSQSGEPTYGGNLKSLTTSTIGERLNTQGRFTPNLLVCDDMLNDGTITKATAAGKKGKSGFVNGYESGDYDIPYGDKGTNSRYYDLDKWFDKVIDNL
jgi:hypothetical protein